MTRLVLAALIALGATPGLATPHCDIPSSGNIVVSGFETRHMGEGERAAFYEQLLRMRGIDARQTTFWGGCIQTTVHENGGFTMRFYDPWTLEEIPVD